MMSFGNMRLAPIVLFVYNRPWHTRQTVKALIENELASSSKLIVYSDGVRSEQDAPLVREVRDYIKGAHGFAEIEIIERDKNWGLADNIINGVTNVVNKYGRIIVLEDDLVTSPYFLRFINEALEFYNEEKKVWHISGYSFPFNTNDVHGAYFYRATSCWGWATWSDRWEKFDHQVHAIQNKFTKNDIYEFNIKNTYDFWSHILKNKEGKMKTWAIFWYVTVFLNSGLCLHPNYTLVQNIGHDGTGTNCGVHSFLAHQDINRNKIINFPKIIEECQTTLEKIMTYNKKNARNIFHRILAKAVRSIR